MQAGTDIFLGWTPNPGERTAFLCAATEGSTTRRCRNPSQNRLPFYAALCGRTLAPAHARAGCRRIFGLYDKEFDKANRLRCETFLLCTHGRAEMRGEY
jgi:hypothetical protein